MFSRIFWPNLV